MSVCLKVLEQPMKASNKRIFWIYLMVFGGIGLTIGRVLFDERYKYGLYVTIPETMKKIDNLEARVWKKYDELDAVYNLPKEFSGKAFMNLYHSYRRVRYIRKLELEKAQTSLLIEDAKEIDKKLVELEKKLTGNNFRI
jgi:hypothetical protein